MTQLKHNQSESLRGRDYGLSIMPIQVKGSILSNILPEIYQKIPMVEFENNLNAAQTELNLSWSYAWRYSLENY